MPSEDKESGVSRQRRRDTDFDRPRTGELHRGPDTRPDDATSQAFAVKLKILTEAIEEIDRAIAARKELSRKFRKQIEKEIEEVKYNLSYLQPPWRIGFQPKVEFIRITLQKSMTSRKKDKRTEQLKLWEHVLGLVKERRKLIMEYQELLSAQKKLRGDGE